MSTALLQPFHPGIPMRASYLVDEGREPSTDRDRAAADRDRAGPVSLLWGRVPCLPQGRTAASRALELIPWLERVRRYRFCLASGAKRCCRTGDQSPTDDFDRRADSAACPLGGSLEPGWRLQGTRTAIGRHRGRSEEICSEATCRFDTAGNIQRGRKGVSADEQSSSAATGGIPELARA